MPNAFVPKLCRTQADHSRTLERTRPLQPSCSTSNSYAHLHAQLAIAASSSASRAFASPMKWLEWRAFPAFRGLAKLPGVVA